MTDLAVQVVAPPQDHLGEGPHWDQVAQRLLRVDATFGRLVSLDPATGRQEITSVDGAVGFAIPRSGGGMVLGVEQEIRLVDEDGAAQIAGLAEPRPGTRLNDGKCDPAGRLWTGTMSLADEPGAGALYRLDPGTELTRVLGGITVANGPAWSRAGDRMYFADSPSARIDVFDYDVATGEATRRRPFVRFEPGEGFPDGMTVDSENCLWVCAFEGGEVRRYDADGDLVGRCTLPVSNPTSLAFGGPGLDVLYVTSARHRLSDTQLGAEPLAGAVFAVDPQVTGLPAVPCSL